MVLNLFDLLYLQYKLSQMALIYYSISEYIQSRDSLKARIEAIEVLIDDMYANMTDAIGNDGTASYSLDDGQMKIQTQYRSVSDITKGINALEAQLQMYINRYNGRKTILRGRLNY